MATFLCVTVYFLLVDYTFGNASSTVDIYVFAY